MKKLIALSTTLALALLMTGAAFAQQNAASSTSPRTRVVARAITVVPSVGTVISSDNGGTSWKSTQNLAEIQRRSQRMEQLKMMAQSARRDSSENVVPMPASVQTMKATTASQYVNRHERQTLAVTMQTASGF